MSGRSDDGGKGHHHQHKLLACDDTMKKRVSIPISLTTVLLVKAFKKGEPLALFRYAG